MSEVCIIMISIRADYSRRVREKDPVLGIVTVKLADLFKDKSEVTRLFSLQEGIGTSFHSLSS